MFTVPTHRTGGSLERVYSGGVHLCAHKGGSIVIIKGNETSLKEEVPLELIIWPFEEGNVLIYILWMNGLMDE
jgi:hypothetical protein